MCIRSFIAACISFFRDLIDLYKVGFYEFFWAFMYLFVNRNAKEIKGETILITGTGSGIGKDLAHKLAKMGNIIICVDINKDANEDTVKQIIEEGGRAHGYHCNVANQAEVKKMHEKTLADVGRVSYLFNVAGVVSGKRFRELLPQDIQRTMDVNVCSVFWLTQTYIEDMIELGYGHVTTISSVAGLFGVPKLVDYCASKFAIMGFVEALRFEMIEENLPIDITVINPFFIRTGMFNGVCSKWPLLCPILEPGYVGDKIIQAVQHRRVIVVLPRLFYYLMIVKSMSPDKVAMQVSKFCGTYEVMASFVGRLTTIRSNKSIASSSSSS